MGNNLSIPVGARRADLMAFAEAYGAWAATKGDA